MKARYSWVVADAVNQVMRCERCKETQPLSAINGVTIEFAVKIIRAFTAMHRKCKDQTIKGENNESIL